MSPPRLATTGQASTCMRGLSVSPRRSAASLPRSLRARRSAPTNSAARSLGVRLVSLMGDRSWLRACFGMEGESAEAKDVRLDLARGLARTGLLVSVERGGLDGLSPSAVPQIGGEVRIAGQINQR